MGSQTHFMVLSPVTECILAVDLLSSWQNLYIVSLTYEVRVMLVGNAKRKPLEPPLPGKIVNQMQYCIPEGLQRLVSPLRL